MPFISIQQLVFKAVVVFLAGFLLVACDDSAKTATENKAENQLPQAAFTVLVNKSPNFESPAGWGAGYASAVGHGAGVVVGPGPNAPNVFAQVFMVKPNEQFKIIARASSVKKPQAKGRLQVNWNGAGKYISTSSTIIDVSETEKTFELQVTAPAGAETGVLYVVPHGGDDTVRYTEMKLMGTDARAKTN